MKVLPDKWYRFEYKEHIKYFIQEIFSNYKITYDQQSAYTIFGDKEMLYLKTETNGTYSIRYRTTYRDDYETLQYTVYYPEYCTPKRNIDISGSYPSKMLRKLTEDDLITKEDNKMELIAKAKGKELQELRVSYEKTCADYIKSTDAGKEVMGAINTLAQFTKVSLNEKEVLQSVELNEEQFNKIKEFTNKYDEDGKAIDDKFFELTELYRITQTYEQRTALLKEYGIIKGVK